MQFIVNKAYIEKILIDNIEDISAYVEAFLSKELLWQEKTEDYWRETYDMPSVYRNYEYGPGIYGEWLCHAENPEMKLVWYNTRFQNDKVVIDGECIFASMIIATKAYCGEEENIELGDFEFGPVNETVFFEFSCDKNGICELTDTCSIRRDYKEIEGMQDRIFRDYYKYTR